MLRVIQEKIASCCGLRIQSKSVYSDGSLYSHAIERKNCSDLLP